MKEEKHISELEIENLEDIYRDFVARSSLFALISIIILFLISPNFFDRLQYEDGYIENLTVFFLFIAILGIGKYLLNELKHGRVTSLKRLFVTIQLLAFFSVALYASLQELEFGQRAIGYELSDSSKDVTKGDAMNLHHRENMEIFLAFGAIVFSTYTSIIPYVFRKPLNEKIIPAKLSYLSTWILKIPRSLVPAFIVGIILILIEVLSPLVTEELEEFNEYSEVCFAYALALLGTYLWRAVDQDRFN
tara:strand:- start:1790 stop:2533 length:744 start_codon:yes stop_codon:yes gene_type:complete